MSDLDCSSGVRVYNDDENDLKCKSKKLIDDALKALIGEPQPVISTQELMSLCSGEFKTQESQVQVLYFIYILKLLILFLMFRKIKILFLMCKLII